MVRTREIPSARNQQRNVTNRNSSTNNRNSQKSNIIEKNKFQKGGIKTPIAAPTPTPSTIATKATVSTYDMTIRSSINSSTAKENMEDMSSSSRHHRVVVADGNTRPTTTHEHVNKAPNTDDILARWKRESIRQPDRPMKDITNKVRIRGSQFMQNAFNDLQDLIARFTKTPTVSQSEVKCTEMLKQHLLP